MKKIALLLSLLMLNMHACAGAEELPGLKTLTEDHGFTMGAALSYHQLRDSKYLDVVKKHFHTVTTTNEMKAYSLLDERASRAASDGMPVMNYAAADAMVGWAQANGLKVRGHVLVWDAYMCDWFFREGYSQLKDYADPETIQKRTEYYITQVVTHFEEKFPGVVYCWDVVNEAVGDGILEYAPKDARHLRTMRNGAPNPFQKYMGDDYVERTFLYARNAVDALGADIKLYYNDYNAYFADKAAAIQALVRSINSYAQDENGNPRKLVDGVGMQGYIGGYGTQSGCMVDSHVMMIKNAVMGYRALGVDVQITEMAVRNFEKEQSPKHAQFYAKLFEMFASMNTDAGNPLNSVSIWGLIDYPNEPKGTYNYKMNSPFGGLFDEKLEEKEALRMVCEALGK